MIILMKSALILIITNTFCCSKQQKNLKLHFFMNLMILLLINILNNLHLSIKDLKIIVKILSNEQILPTILELIQVLRKACLYWSHL